MSYAHLFASIGVRRLKVKAAAAVADAAIRTSSPLQVYQAGWGNYAKLGRKKSPVGARVLLASRVNGGLTRWFWLIFGRFIFAGRVWEHNQKQRQEKKQIPRGNDRKKSKGNGFDAKGAKVAKFRHGGDDLLRARGLVVIRGG
jgi:hypothetical protein